MTDNFQFDKIDVFGNPYHGMVVNGILNYGNGTISGLDFPSFRPSHIFEQKLPSADVQDELRGENNEYEYRNTLQSFINGNLHVYGVNMGRKGWVFEDSSGDRYIAYAYTAYGDSHPSLKLYGPIFVLSDGTEPAPTPQEHIYAVQDVSVGDPYGYTTEEELKHKFYLADVSPDGRRCAMICYLYDSGLRIGVTEISISGSVSEGTISTTHSVVADVDQCARYDVAFSGTADNREYVESYTETSSGSMPDPDDDSCPPSSLLTTTRRKEFILSGATSYEYIRTHNIKSLVAAWYSNDTVVPVIEEIEFEDKVTYSYTKTPFFYIYNTFTSPRCWIEYDTNIWEGYYEREEYGEGELLKVRDKSFKSWLNGGMQEWWTSHYEFSTEVDHYVNKVKQPGGNDAVWTEEGSEEGVEHLNTSETPIESSAGILESSSPPASSDSEPHDFITYGQLPPPRNLPDIENADISGVSGEWPLWFTPWTDDSGQKKPQTSYSFMPGNVYGGTRDITLIRSKRSNVVLRSNFSMTPWDDGYATVIKTARYLTDSGPKSLNLPDGHFEVYDRHSGTLTSMDSDQAESAYFV